MYLFIQVFMYSIIIIFFIYSSIRKDNLVSARSITGNLIAHLFLFSSIQLFKLIDYSFYSAVIIFIFSVFSVFLNFPFFFIFSFFIVFFNL